MVGYDSNSNNYRLYDPELNEIILTRNASFVEHFPHESSTIIECPRTNPNVNEMTNEETEVMNEAEAAFDDPGWEDQDENNTEETEDTIGISAEQGNEPSYATPSTSQVQVNIRTARGESSTTVTFGRRTKIPLPSTSASTAQEQGRVLRDRSKLKPPPPICDSFADRLKKRFMYTSPTMTAGAIREE